MICCNKVNCVPLAATELTRILFHQYVQKALPTQQLLLSVQLSHCRMKQHFRNEKPNTTNAPMKKKLWLSKKDGGGCRAADVYISKGGGAFSSQWEQRTAAKQEAQFAQVASVSLRFRRPCGSLPVWLCPVPVVSPAWLEPFLLYLLVKRSGHHHHAFSAWHACALTHVGISAEIRKRIGSNRLGFWSSLFFMLENSKIISQTLY